MGFIDFMHWRHVSITTTPCWGSRLVALRARVVLGERCVVGALSQYAGPGRPGGMACRGWPASCMLGDGARDSASFDPQRAGAPFCDVICIRSIVHIHSRLVVGEKQQQPSFKFQVSRAGLPFSNIFAYFDHKESFYILSTVTL